MKKANVVVAGGCGQWSDKTHLAAIMDLKRQGIDVRLVAVCDTINPSSAKNRPNLSELVRLDAPLWIDAGSKDYCAIMKELDRIHQGIGIAAFIVATNPVYHYGYSAWAINNGINVSCDKPLVVTRNAASDLERAEQIWPQYLELRRRVLKAKERDERYMAVCPLRRRSMPMFVNIADSLAAVHSETGEGIRYLNMIVNGGLHKYPIELMHDGAHGYLDGVGSLSHSSYHYVDLLAWYISSAMGKTYELEIELPYLFRLRDYIDMRGYSTLMKLIEGNTSLDVNVQLPEAVLNSEQDFTFHMKLKDTDRKLTGLVSYSCNHTTFTPRTQRYDSTLAEHAESKSGGRMSQLYLDIHQGALQNIQLVKNDVVFFGNTITTTKRVHPVLGSDVKDSVGDAYVNGAITPSEMVGNFIRYSAGMDFDRTVLDATTRYEDQVFTNRIFSKFYELMAKQAAGIPRSSDTIILRDLVRGCADETD